MFSSLIKQYNNIDHYILQLSSLNIVDICIKKDGNKVDINNQKFSLIICGGFNPGIYEIFCGDKYVQYFIIKDGKELKAGIINKKLTINLKRYGYSII